MLLDLTLSLAQEFILRAVRHSVCAAERAEIARYYATVGDAIAWQTAQSNRVESIVAHALMDALGKANVPAHWCQAHDETHHRISAYLAELDRVAARLAEESIPLVALKNGGIARGLYPCPGCCPMGDLDVLVERRHFQAAHNLLIDEGYSYIARNVMEKAYHRLLPDDIPLWLELLWRPVEGRWIRPDQEPPTEELMARSKPIPGTAVRLLAPEDNLLQVALHTAKHSYVRAPGFRLHLDVERIVRYQEIDWDLFLSRVRALQVKTPVYFSLAIPKALFGTPIPDKVVRALAPPRWKERLISRWLERVGLFNPDDRKFSNPSFLIFHALLYDDLTGLFRALFPEAGWMKDRYGFRSDVLLPYYHVHRWLDLAFRRVLS